MSLPSPVALVPAIVLSGAAGLHLLWGLGSSFPQPDRVQLADAVAGLPVMPPPGACFVVAGSLGAGAALVAGVGGRHRLAALGRWAVAGSLAVRGLAGMTGLTGALVPWSPSSTFRALDRRRYGPLCLGLGATVALSIVASRHPIRTKGRCSGAGLRGGVPWLLVE